MIVPMDLKFRSSRCALSRSSPVSASSTYDLAHLDVDGLIVGLVVSTQGREAALGARKIRALLERGNRTLVFSWEVGKSCSVFKGCSDITCVFGPLRSLQNFSLSEWRLRAP